MINLINVHHTGGNLVYAVRNASWFLCKVSCCSHAGKVEAEFEGGQAEVSLNKVSNWAALQALVKDIDSVIKKQHSA